MKKKTPPLLDASFKTLKEYQSTIIKYQKIDGMEPKLVIIHNNNLIITVIVRAFKNERSNKSVDTLNLLKQLNVFL